MAELSTIARPYAEALFAAASSDKSAAGVLDQWLEVVAEMAAVARHAEVAQVVGDPNLGSDQIYKLVHGLIKSPLPIAAENFLRLVVDNGRLAALPEIATQFHALVNASSGVSDATLYSAFEIAPDLLADVVAALEKRFGRRLNPHVVVDPELIGGIRVVVGDEVLDTSVKARLEQMKVALTA